MLAAETPSIKENKAPKLKAAAMMTKTEDLCATKSCRKLSVRPEHLVPWSLHVRVLFEVRLAGILFVYFLC